MLKVFELPGAFLFKNRDILAIPGYVCLFSSSTLLLAFIPSPAVPLVLHPEPFCVLARPQALILYTKRKGEKKKTL